MRQVLVGLCMTMLFGGWLSVAEAQSNLYKMRNGAVITQMGQELVTSTNIMCNEYAKIQGHLAAMIRQRDSSTDYNTVAIQYGTIDVVTNAISEPVAEAMFTELNAMVGNTQAAVLQWCASVRQ